MKKISKNEMVLGLFGLVFVFPKSITAQRVSGNLIAWTGTAEGNRTLILITKRKFNK